VSPRASRRQPTPAADLLAGLTTDPLRAMTDDLLSGAATSSNSDTCGKCGGSSGSHLLTCPTQVGE